MVQPRATSKHQAWKEFEIRNVSNTQYIQTETQYKPACSGKGKMQASEQNKPIQTLKKTNIYRNLWELLTFPCDQECYGIIHYLAWIRFVQIDDYTPYQEKN